MNKIRITKHSAAFGCLLGAAALCFSMVRTLAADVARLQALKTTAEGAGEP